MLPIKELPTELNRGLGFLFMAGFASWLPHRSQGERASCRRSGLLQFVPVTALNQANNSFHLSERGCVGDRYFIDVGLKAYRTNERSCSVASPLLLPR